MPVWTGSHMINVTDSAVKQLRVILLETAETAENAGKGLRIFVEAGSCHGIQYGMAAGGQQA